MEWSLLPLSVRLISSIINSLLGRQTQWATLFRRNFIKRWFCSKWSCLLCFVLPACRLELMLSSLSSIDFNFQLPVDFEFNVFLSFSFPVLHHNSMETSWFSLMMLETQSPFLEEKSMQSTRNLVPIPLCLCCSSRASALSKTTLKHFNQTWIVWGFCFSMRFNWSERVLWSDEV